MEDPAPPSVTALLDAMRRAHRLYFRDVERPELFGQMLSDILELTGCEYGFIGEVLLDPDDQPYLKSWALTDIAWDEPTRALYAQSQSPDGGMVFTNLNTLFGRVLTTGRPVLANDAPNDPRRGGLPHGHPALQSFMGIPLIRNDEMVGMVGVANRPGGFHEDDVEFLEPYLELCAHLIDVIRTDQERSRAQSAEREASERALRQERLSLIGRLASGIAHDMNNLITVVSMQCELLELDEGLSPDAQRGIARIQEVCDIASSMATRLNGLRTRSPDAVVQCSPRSVIEQSVGMMDSLAGEGIQFDVHVGDHLTPHHEVSMSDSDLLQILLNLISNARDALEGSGRIDVAVDVEHHATGPVVVLTCADDGPGVPSTLRGSAFDPFSSSKGPGHGLGLPTVRTLVEMAGGTITLVDDATTGATFRVVLPVLNR